MDRKECGTQLELRSPTGRNMRCVVCPGARCAMRCVQARPDAIWNMRCAQVQLTLPGSPDATWRKALEVVLRDVPMCAELDQKSRVQFFFADGVWLRSEFFRATIRHGSKILPALRFSNPVYFFTAEIILLGFLKFGYFVHVNHAQWNKSNLPFFFKNPIIQPNRCEETPVQMLSRVSVANSSKGLTSFSFQIASENSFSPVLLDIPFMQLSHCLSSSSWHPKPQSRIILRYLAWSRMRYSSSYSPKQLRGTSQ